MAAPIVSGPAFDLTGLFIDEACVIGDHRPGRMTDRRQLQKSTQTQSAQPGEAAQCKARKRSLVKAHSGQFEWGDSEDSRAYLLNVSL